MELGSSGAACAQPSPGHRGASSRGTAITYTRPPGVGASGLNFRHKGGVSLAALARAMASGWIETGTIAMPTPSNKTGFTPSEVADEAIRIIEAVADYTPLRPLEYAKALDAREPGAAALARVLTSEDILKEAQTYRAADRSATWWRRVYGLLARAGLVFTLLSVVLAGVGFYAAASAGASAIEATRAYIGQTQIVLLMLWFVCVIVLVVLKPARRWFRARAAAELSRQRLFGLLMSSTSEPAKTEIPLLPLQLECFRRHFLESQRQFFQARSRQNRFARNAGRVLGGVALLFVGIATLPQLLSSLTELGALNRVPALLIEFISRLLADKKIFALAWLLGTSLQLFVTYLAMISPVARHAERYQIMTMLLDLDPSLLIDAREAAASGVRGPVEWFSKSVLSAVSAETRMWLKLQGA